jgi:maleylacetate reductase
MKRIERAMQTQNAARGIFDLMQELQAPLALKDIGMKHEDLGRAVSLVMQAPYYNPRPTDHDSVLSLLNEAFFGRRP